MVSEVKSRAEVSPFRGIFGLVHRFVVVRVNRNRIQWILCSCQKEILRRTENDLNKIGQKITSCLLEFLERILERKFKFEWQPF